MAERQILLDTINVGWSEERRFSQRSAAFGAFTLKQMPFASAVEQDLAGTSYLEPFGHGLPGFNAFGASHRCLVSFLKLCVVEIHDAKICEGKVSPFGA